MGSTSYVVRVELDPNGKVTNARLMTSNAEGAFPEQILDAVRQWQFVPRDKSHSGAWVKYFTFKAQAPAP
jgi:TonB family protein